MRPLDVVVAGVPVRLCVDPEAGRATERRAGRFLRAVRARFAGAAGGLDATLPRDRSVRVRVQGGVATLCQGARRGSIDLARASIVAPPDVAFADTLVRAAVCWRHALAGALLLHAAAVPHADGVAVVFGASGAGKSTVARALGPALSDELVLLESPATGSDRWQVAGTPWWRGTGGRAPLARLVWLVRGEPQAVRSVAGTVLVRALAAEAARYFGEAGFQRRLFDLCVDLARLGALRVAAAEGRAAEDVRAALAAEAPS
jgi:hypothetical protein